MDHDFVLAIPNWVPLVVTVYLLIGTLVVAVYNTSAKSTDRWDGPFSCLVAIFWLPIAAYYVFCAVVIAAINK